MYADANRLVLSGDLKPPIVSADLVDGDREFQTVGAAIENDLSVNELKSEGRCSLLMVDERMRLRSSRSICISDSSPLTACTPLFRVRTNPGKGRKVMEFKFEIFQALKSLETDQRCGKGWKKSLKTLRLTWKIWLFIALVNTPLCLLPCLHYMSSTFCGQNFDVVLISAKTISTHLYNEILS